MGIFSWLWPFGKKKEEEFLILGFILEIALSLGGSSGGSGFSGGDFGGGGSALS